MKGAALEAAYWSQLVGNFAWRARPAPITSLNFAAFSPFHTFPAGSASGNHWGDAIALLKTNARSPYFFNFHKGDLGHTLIIGPSGGGKTVLLNFLMAQAEKTGARQISSTRIAERKSLSRPAAAHISRSITASRPDSLRSRRSPTAQRTRVSCRCSSASSSALTANQFRFRKND